MFALSDLLLGRTARAAPTLEPGPNLRQPIPIARSERTKVVPALTQAQRFALNPASFSERGQDIGFPLFSVDIELHARALLRWVQPEWAGREIRVTHLFEKYMEMCLQLWWAPHRWSHRNGIGEEFRRISANGKHYAYFDAPRGGRQRALVYRIPMPEPTRRRRKVIPKSRGSGSD